MKRIFLIMICMTLLSGCIEQKVDKAGPMEKTQGKLIITISSPGDGQILKGDKDVLFEAAAKGGKGPYAYRWSSNIDGELSVKSSFRQDPSDLAKGRHTIIVAAKDSNGVSGQGSVQINVL
jgi:hypothetical protein